METEKRLTDANELLHKFCVKCNAIYSEEPCEPSECIFYEMVKNAPIVDAVEVVRCKDCLYAYRIDSAKELYDCRKSVRFGMPMWSKPDDFCSYGERRTDGNSNSD